MAVLLLTACDENLMATDSAAFTNTAWNAGESVEFQLEPVDTINDYDIYLNMRNNQNYAYKNIWLITQMKFPQGKVFTDTLEYAMANARGEFLGSGKDVIENKLVFKREFRFRESGTYQLKLQQAMRKSGSATPLKELSGVLDIGYTIEKQIENGSN